MRSICIETYGCSANQNNSEIMAGLLSRAGFAIVSDGKNADIIVLNSCIVKGPTLQKIIYRIKELSGTDKKLIVAGCMPDVMSKRIGLIAPNASILGSHHVNDIVLAAKKLVEGKRSCLISKEHEVRLCMPKAYAKRTIGITQLSEGCVGDCSYCLVRSAKGPLHSYQKEDIIKNIKQDLKAGCKEIWLTSQDCSAYGLDQSKRSQLPSLLKEILKLKGRFKLRLGMSNPNHILPIMDDMIKLYKDNKMFRFLHIPVQSGSDKVLKEMNRHYSSDDFISIVESFRKDIPGITISTDMIAAYPTETEKDFEDSLEILRKTRPDIINISRYWPMPGTKASMLQQIEAEESKRRTAMMLKLHNQITLEINKSLIGQEFDCLVDEKSFDDFYVCRSDSYRMIMLKSKDNILGKKVKVKIFDATMHWLMGKIV